jgi:hypothetical protein
LDVLFPATNTVNATRDLQNGKQSETIEDHAAALEIALLGKYPITVGPVTAFPLVGLDYTLDFGDIDRSQFGLDFGLGCDLPLSVFTTSVAILDNLYLRTAALYTLHFASPAQKDAESVWKDQTSPGNVYSDVEAETALTHGVQFKVAVGYKF